MDFQLEAPFAPSGDQPEAIEALAKGVKEGMDTQVLWGQRVLARLLPLPR